MADFGKGKSVFLRHYAALLSKEYIHHGTGYFPVYFNLSSYNKYAADHQLGVIGNYLENQYGIKINDEASKYRRYIFPADSLDECGDLDVTNIDKVIDAVKKIQNIDRAEVKLNKILITTRPFDNGLNKHLRRPIFAYMIYQLLGNAINFDQTGGIGIYLSFLNLLTKEAKYIHDINYNINLMEQFEARSILHTIAAIWLFNFNASGKTEIKKADIYRSFKEELIDESDRKVITTFIESGRKELKFLSHSYFGDQNNTLHFQHQSFAEILMAEYYLKVLIKHAFEDDPDVDAARVKLTVGMPTEQTIRFLTDLLGLLRDSTGGKNCMEKEVTFPLTGISFFIKEQQVPVQ